MKIFSPSRRAFYDPALQDSYEAAGTWPNDPVPVSDDVWQLYATGAPPAGKRLGFDQYMQPTWEDAPPVAQTREQEVDAALAAGFTAEWENNPELNGTYSLDPTTQQQITTLAQNAKAGLGFPTIPDGTSDTILFPDASRTHHLFNADTMQKLFMAMRNYVYWLEVYKAGGAPSMPPQPWLIV